VTLIEPRQKRAAFLTTVCALLKLQDVNVVEATIDAKHPLVELAGQFDCILMRAVTDPLKAKGLAALLLKLSGLIVIWGSELQAARAGPQFAVHRYRIPRTDITHALLLARRTT
jgi:16S rRNA G527 N7-methylase RsmG